MFKLIATFIGTVILMVFTIGIALIYGSLSWGFVVYKFWYWFLLPVFTTILHITYWLAVGLFLFINLFNIHSHEQIKDEYLKDGKTLLIGAILAPWLTLLIGMFIKTIIM